MSPTLTIPLTLTIKVDAKEYDDMFEEFEDGVAMISQSLIDLMGTIRRVHGLDVISVDVDGQGEPVKED